VLDIVGYKKAHDKLYKDGQEGRYGQHVFPIWCFQDYPLVPTDHPTHIESWGNVIAAGRRSRAST
jgi:hypothetical protein